MSDRPASGGTRQEGQAGDHPQHQQQMDQTFGGVTRHAGGGLLERLRGFLHAGRIMQHAVRPPRSRRPAASSSPPPACRRARASRCPGHAQTPSAGEIQEFAGTAAPPQASSAMASRSMTADSALPEREVVERRPPLIVRDELEADVQRLRHSRCPATTSPVASAVPDRRYSRSRKFISPRFHARPSSPRRSA